MSGASRQQTRLRATTAEAAGYEARETAAARGVKTRTPHWSVLSEGKEGTAE